MIIYCFDIKSGNKKRFNTVKRRFYYELKRLGLSERFWSTKSVLYVQDDKAVLLDAFFSKFKEDLTLFKGEVILLERVY